MSMLLSQAMMWNHTGHTESHQEETERDAACHGRLRPSHGVNLKASSQGFVGGRNEIAPQRKACSVGRL